MSEELQQYVELAQGQGPPELIIKLALQYLTWKDVMSFTDCDPLLLSVALVCKKWKDLLETDEVGRPLCLNLLKLYDYEIAMHNRSARARAEEQGRNEDYQDQVYYYKKHELLAQLIKSGPPWGRSYKDLFVVSDRMGGLMNTHGWVGPDVHVPQTHHDRDTRTLREASIQDYRWIVRPTIERLRDVFDSRDDNDGERMNNAMEMRKRLLHHAQGDGRAMLLRKESLQKEKEEIAEEAGRMVLMLLAASKDSDQRLFMPSSPLASVSLENVIDGLEAIKGSEIAVQLSLQLKKTTSGMKRKFSFLPSKSEICWPVNPVDTTNFIFHI